MLGINGNAAVLWSGGKDCSLAHYLAVKAGMDVRCLVTFAPPDAKFCAHPLEVMKGQAEAMGLAHHIVNVVEPYFDSYRAGIERLRDEFGIEVLVTGDIAEVEGHPNWIRQCCEDTGVEVYTPLWGKSRREILTELLDSGFRIIFSCVKEPKLSAEWLGKELNYEALRELDELSAVNGIDICGENGEFHTVALDGPLFGKAIELEGCAKGSSGELVYLGVAGVRIVGKE